MKKISTIFTVCLLGIFLIIPSSFGEGKYSYRFEKFLELIDYYYFQPNNLDRERIEKERPYVMAEIMGHAFLQQKRFSSGWRNPLFEEFKRRDLYKYSEEVTNKSNYKTYDPNVGWLRVGPEGYVMEIEAYGVHTGLDREKSIMDQIKKDLGKDFRTEGDKMPSFNKWAQEGYPAFEIPVRAVPMPPEIKKTPYKNVQEEKLYKKKAIELLGVEAESTEDLHFDGGFQKKTPNENNKAVKMPDPKSAPDFDEFLKNQ